MRYSMNLDLIPAEHASILTLEYNCLKHISVINDIYSWEKELKVSETGHNEGSVLYSAVKVIADKANLRYDQA